MPGEAIANTIAISYKAPCEIRDEILGSASAKYVRATERRQNW